MLKPSTQNSPQSTRAYIKQCLGPNIIPAIHCRPANLTRIYHSNLCRRYCSSCHGVSQPLLRRNSKPTYLQFKTGLKMKNGSQVDPRNIHYTYRNVPLPPGPYKNVQLPQEDVNIWGYTLTGDLPGTNTFS
jgi:hypothetical protein